MHFGHFMMWCVHGCVRKLKKPCASNYLIKKVTNGWTKIITTQVIVLISDYVQLIVTNKKVFTPSFWTVWIIASLFKWCQQVCVWSTEQPLSQASHTSSSSSSFPKCEFGGCGKFRGRVGPFVWVVLRGHRCRSPETQRRLMISRPLLE